MNTVLSNQIHHKLTAAFCPALLEVSDESHLHRGHAGVKAAGGFHMAVTMVSDQFIGHNRLKRHRMVQNVLETELKNTDRQGLHALRLTLKTPEEWQRHEG